MCVGPFKHRWETRKKFFDGLVRSTGLQKTLKIYLETKNYQ